MAKKAPVQSKREIADALRAPKRGLDEATFRRLFATVLRRYGKTFQALADFDRGIR
jgi:hypothetical protein